MRESEEKLRLIFENAFDGISVYEELPDEDQRILLECNERYCQMAGRSKDELLTVSDTRAIQRSIENAEAENRLGIDQNSTALFGGFFVDSARW